MFTNIYVTDKNSRRKPALRLTSQIKALSLDPHFFMFNEDQWESLKSRTWLGIRKECRLKGHASFLYVVNQKNNYTGHLQSSSWYTLYPHVFEDFLPHHARYVCERSLNTTVPQAPIENMTFSFSSHFGKSFMAQNVISHSIFILTRIHWFTVSRHSALAPNRDLFAWKTECILGVNCLCGITE